MVTLARDEIKWALWTRVARDFQVCFGQKKTEERLIFEGFHRDVRSLLSTPPSVVCEVAKQLSKRSTFIATPLASSPRDPSPVPPADDRPLLKLRQQDYDGLNKVLKGWGLELEAKETSLRGWNWGQTDVQGSSPPLAAGLSLWTSWLYLS